jgi:tripartite-type tricarboxylate transporter receptor subunit TctC
MSSAVPGYDYALWWGLLAPAGTPAPIVTRLNQVINRALAKPSVQRQFLAEGAEVKAVTPVQFGSIIARDIERWKKLARQQNIVSD